MRAWVCIFLAILFFGCLGLGVDNKAAARAKCGAINAANINQTYPTALGECHWGPRIDCVRDYCYMDYALATMDPAVCSAVVPAVTDASASGANTINKEDCYGAVIVKSNDTAICDRVVDTNDRDDCNYQLGFIYNNYTFCDKISNLSKRDYCYDATSADNPTICDKISDQRLKDYCYGGYNGIARYSHDPDMCDKISDSDRKDDCYESVAIGIINPASYNTVGSANSTICDKISKSSTKDDCYYEIAIGTPNPDLCDKISDPFTKGVCHSNVRTG